MQTLNENQVVIQNTRTGKRAIVTKHFFESQIKAHKTSKFHEFEIVPTATVSAETETEETKPKRKSKSE
jgi:hypothetical protein